MAFDQFPKTITDLRTKTKSFSPEVQGELSLLFKYLKKKFPKIETPINLDLSKKTTANITRQIQEDIKIDKIKKEVDLKKITVRFGNGSSGNRGVNNRGNLFEPEFAKAMLDWWSGKKVKDPKMLAAIEDLDETYGLSEQDDFKVDIVGGENTKRPLIYTPVLKLTNPKGSGYDIGKSVTDLTVHSGRKQIYLSLKLGTTTTFFNVGIRTTLTPDEIKSYNIKNKNGKILLKTFGIQQKLFCDVFNGRLKKGIVKTPKLGSIDELLKTGIGSGYHIIHKMTGKIISKKMDRRAMAKASKVGSAKVYYGGKTGLGKRIDIEMESPTYKFKLNIRDTQGKDGYPTRLMCDFTTK